MKKVEINKQLSRLQADVLKLSCNNRGVISNSKYDDLKDIK